MDTNNRISSIEIREAGRVKEVTQGIVKAEGLPSCIYGQLVEFDDDVKGVVLGFNPEEVLIIVLGDYRKIKVGDFLASKNQMLSVPVGEDFVGRIVDCLAQPLDDKGEINAVDNFPVFREAPGVMEREPIRDALLTGIKVIDVTIPIGKGQRELIIGDRQTGRTSIALDAIINQKERDVICIYCFIGGTFSNFKKIAHKLIEKEALAYSICVCSLASHSSAEQYIAPYTAAALGEYFMQKGKDVVVVFDDLTKHAWAYRQISLLLERAPGREAYPGDIFYIHSQLMERAGKLHSKLGGGTMSFFPIAETLNGDITSYIPSNIISMTDGQIYLNSNLFNEGFKPAVDVGLSVSRIGARIQPPALRNVSSGLRLDYLQYRELLKLMKLRTKLSAEAQEIVKRGRALEELFIQENYNPLSLVEEVVLFYAFQRKILEILAPDVVNNFKNNFFNFLSNAHPHIIEAIEKESSLDEAVKNELNQAFIEFFRGLNK